MNDELNCKDTEITDSEERNGTVIETVELTISRPKVGTLIKCSDHSGFDQTPVPEITPLSDIYFIDRITVDGVEREEAYWKTYSTLEFYKDEKMKKGEKYTVFAKVKACPGYIFYDPVNLYVNGDLLSSEEVEDYTYEGDSFCFYYDIEAVE